MFNALLKSLRDWNLEHKLFSITLDNATNNDKIVGHLKANFLGRDLIPCNGELLHMRCAARATILSHPIHRYLSTISHRIGHPSSIKEHDATRAISF
ncbi:hypothetical protein PR202_ga08124 [Eleusine coracana subsp. coracana]|uniref:AC transposase n=1 Tax=Eleusine coracana subsp. coracana TaxID=191504 RepID=A0AAV5C1P8_ELECO|nr:hypothetical protein PR202_ga08124 [Eleusine coracana subsp. coracana]